MKRTLALTLALTMALSLCACGADNGSQPDTASQTTEAAKELAPADQLLEDVKGTYDELFTVICDPQYDQIWLDKCEAIVGADMAEMCAEMLKSACTGTLYGEDAVNAYANAEGAQFDCYFINGVHQFVFDGSKISGLDENGGEVFSHEYAYVKDFSLGGMMDGYLYETADENAGEFRYFLMMPDTPASTYHIEFRYGSDEAALAEYAEGAYAYWLAAGILADRDQTMIENVIGLFAEENLAEMADADAAAEASDTVEIGTAEELVAFAKSVTDGSKGGYAGQTVVLTADIDCTDVEWTPIGTMDVGGLIGTGLYYYGEETAFKVVDCKVNGEIVGAVTPGAVAGRAEHSVIERCDAAVTLDGEALTDEIGKTDKLYESADQSGEEEAAEEAPAA